jgi:hypothetical protein
MILELQNVNKTPRNYRLSPAERGLEAFHDFFPEAHAPGFMLTPAPQARCCQFLT